MQDILGDLRGIIRGPVKNSLVKPTCTQVNSWAKNFEVAKFNVTAENFEVAKFNVTAAFPRCNDDCQTIKAAYARIYPGVDFPCTARRLEGMDGGSETPALAGSDNPS